jgi:DNA-nicking Smr family endonuclease
VVHEEDIIELPVDGILDLHAFKPEDAASALGEYLRVCAEKGIHEVKVIHGKGKGILRLTVHKALERNPLVLDFQLDTGASGWGATLVHLKNPR